jgi:hypothetical protein
MTTKEAALSIIHQMPDDTTLPDIMAQLYFLRKVEEAERQIEAGEELEHEEVKQRLGRWLS